MFSYAVIDENNIVKEVKYVHIPPERAPQNYIYLGTGQPDMSLLGKVWNGQEFIEQQPTPKPILQVIFPSDIITVGQDATIEFKILNPDGSVDTDFNGQYKILLRDDLGNIIKPILLTITNGQGSLTLRSSKAQRVKIYANDFKNVKLERDEVYIDFVETVTDIIEL